MFISALKQLLYYLFVSSTLNPNPSQLYSTPLIPRDALLGNPDKTSAKLSPDGKVLAYMAPLDGVLNVWVQPLEQVLSGVDTARAVTFDKGRGILGYSWTYKEGVLVYVQDAGGDENYVLYKLDVANPRAPIATVLTDTEGVRAQIVDSNRFHPDILIIGLNNRNPSYHDLYRVNLETGEKELILINDEFAAFIFDNDMQLRLALKENDDAGTDYFKAVENPTNDSMIDWKLYKSIGFEDDYSTGMAGFDKTNQRVYWLSSEGRDLNAFYISDFDTPDNKEMLFEPQKSDVGGIWMHATEYVPLAAKEMYDYPKLTILNETVRADLDYLDTLESDGRASVVQTSIDMETWLVAWFRDDGPVAYYVYLRPQRKASFLFSTKASLLNYKHSSMTAVEVQTRDGFTQLCYVSIPVEFETDSHIPTQPLPLLLNVHGGPWARDTWGFRSETQLFANRGYAVMQCNFRSSTGFGKNWVNAGNGEWGKDMHTDLLDAIQWAIDNGIADESKIGIFGGSYGGYAALAALAFTPDRFTCAVDVVGPSNLETLINSVPEYWKPLRNSLVKRIGGDPETEEGKEYLASRSPVNFADRIKRPLLILQGANDPRVKQNESDQIATAMKSHDIPVTYVLFPDEGHGFVRPENRLAFIAITEQFLASCLGGRAEPASAAVSKSTAQIIEKGNLCIPTEKKDGIWVNPCGSM